MSPGGVQLDARSGRTHDDSPAARPTQVVVNEEQIKFAGKKGAVRSDRYEVEAVAWNRLV